MSRSPLASAKELECKHDNTPLLDTCSAAEKREVKLSTSASANQMDETLHPPRKLDPKREWELSPLKEALTQFIQSDEVFQRPAFKPPISMPRNDSPTIQKNTSMPLNKPSKHSILTFLKLDEHDKIAIAKQRVDHREKCIQTSTDDSVARRGNDPQTNSANDRTTGYTSQKQVRRSKRGG